MLPLRNKKAQGSLETLILIGGAVLIAVIVITIITSLGSSSRNNISEQTDKLSKSKDMPFAPNIVSVDARYSDCVNSKDHAVLRFSWKPISNDGTFRLIIENSKNVPIGNLDYLVVNNLEPQDMNNLNPNITTDLLVTEINIGTGGCGDTYFLSIEVEKNSQIQKSSRYPFRWNKQGDPTVLVYRPSFNPVPDSYNISQFPLTISLTVLDPTGYIIYYTTDGSPPTTLSNIYDGSGISANAGQTIKAISHYGALVSSEASGTYIASYYTVANPIAIPGDSINLINPTLVSLSSTTPSTQIYYTLDGSDPTSTIGTIYSSALTLTSTTTLKAVCYAPDYSTSSIFTQNYTLLENVAPVTFNPTNGSFNNDVSVTLASSTAGTSIRYTLDGSTPTETIGTLVSSPTSIIIGASGSIKAIAFRTGMGPSTVSTSGLFSFSAGTPTSTQAASTYTSAITVPLTSVTSGSTIRYTINGVDPTSTTGSVYLTPISLSTTGTYVIRAKTFKAGYTDSAVFNNIYVINLPAATPIFNPAGGNFPISVSVLISCTTPSSSIRYTTDGSVPTNSFGIIYSGSFILTSTATVKAVCYASGYSTSPVVTQTFNVQEKVPSPTFSIPSGEIVFGTNVTINSAIADVIYYTIDGSTPTTSSINQAITPLVINAEITVRAIAVKAGYLNSDIVSESYIQVSARLNNLVLTNYTGNYNFLSTTYTYNDILILNTLSSITATPTGPGTITVNGSSVSSGTASGQIDLSDGTQKTITVVSSAIGMKTVTYNLYVTKIITTGGYITDGAGYRIHRFASGSTFTLNTPLTTQLLVVGGGGSAGAYNGGGGAGGALYYSSAYSILSGSTSVTIGAGGKKSYYVNGFSGGTSIFGAISRSGGYGGLKGGQGRGGNGAGGSGSAYNGSIAYGKEGPGLSYSIAGSSVEYARGGRGGQFGSTGPSNTGWGGGASTRSTQGYRGGSGIVVVRISVS